MSDTVIKIENLSKRYIIGHETGAPYMALRDVLTEGMKKLNPLNWKDGGASSKEEFWALKDINLEIKQGEKIGIIGRNGAGKSTLLKILSRITEPTTGKVQIKGRVASLLEVGTGFHPELTGRENIFLNGAILGMRKQEIRRKFDEIVDFSGVEKFLDTPVKRYSSGMYVRLAFAVAAHLEPEILLIDEVLAVGDAEFQKKCLGKMDDVAKQGRTVLFVSHNMTAVKSLCNRGILLVNGEIKHLSSVEETIGKYVSSVNNDELSKSWSFSEAPGNDKVKIKSAKIINYSELDKIRVDVPFEIEFEIWNLMESCQLSYSLHVYSIEGMMIFNSASKVTSVKKGLFKGTCKIPPYLFNDNTYTFMIMIVRDGSYSLFKLHDILTMKIEDVKRTGAWHGKIQGVVRPNLEWKTEFRSVNLEEIDNE